MKRNDDLLFMQKDQICLQKTNFVLKIFYNLSFTLKFTQKYKIKIIKTDYNEKKKRISTRFRKIPYVPILL